MENTHCVASMTDMQYYHYMTSCDELNAKLEKCVTFLMHYIFEGKCKDKGQWEALFVSLSRAVFMKEYLHLYLTISVPSPRTFLCSLRTGMPS